MENNNYITMNDITEYLKSTNVAYSCYGEITKAKSFTSIKHVESNGLYFYSGELLPAEINNSIVLVSDTFEIVDKKNTYIKVANPQLSFYKLMNKYFPKEEGSISKRSLVSNKATIGENVGIGDFTKIGSSIIGDNTVIGNNVVIHDNVTIGKNVTISDNTVIGASGVAWIWDDQTKERIMQPQIGGVLIGDSVFIGSNVTIARGSVNEDTKVLAGSLVSHGTQIGHGVQVHQDVHIANNCSLAGNASIGRECFIGAGAIISSQIIIAPKVTLGAGAIASKNIELEGGIYIGMPARVIPQQDRINGVPKKK